MAVHAENLQVRPDALGRGTEVGSWRVLERLGAGGYGAVYRVEDMTRPGDFYALKMALWPGDERAEREVHLLTSKGIHPNVVHVHASGRWPHPRHGYRYFVMDWLPGLALHTWVETLNPSPRQLAEKVGKVALALGALHSRGVLHRDIKPEHIIISEQDDEPVLIDFGAGRYAGAETITTSALPPATLHLLSPEAVRFIAKHSEHPGARYEARATDDLYALGVCLYRVATGYWPFSPELPPNFLYMRIEAVDPAAPTAVNRRVPRALSDIILRLLSKKPEARFQSGQEVHAALVAAVALGEPEAWARSLFEWEAAEEDVDGSAVPSRRIRLPERPTEPRTSPPRKLVLGPVLSSVARLLTWRAQAAPGHENDARARRTWSRGVAYGLVLVAVVACTAWAANVPRRGLPSPMTEVVRAAPRTGMSSQPSRSSGHEVAQEVKSPETAAAAVPLLEASTPAAVAVPATHVEDPPAVKMPKTDTPPATPTKNAKTSRLGAMSKALCTGATSAALACAGAPQVRSAPPSESCPPGALEAMKKLGIPNGDSRPMTFWRKYSQVVTVREGFTEVEIVGPLGKLPNGTRITGRLFLGNGRVYGHLTEAHPSDDETVPVCLELLDTDFKPGLEQTPGGSADTARVFSAGHVLAVRRFE